MEKKTKKNTQWRGRTTRAKTNNKFKYTRSKFIVRSFDMQLNRVYSIFSRARDINLSTHILALLFYVLIIISLHSFFMSTLRFYFSSFSSSFLFIFSFFSCEILNIYLQHIAKFNFITKYMYILIGIFFTKKNCNDFHLIQCRTMNRSICAEASQVKQSKAAYCISNNCSTCPEPTNGLLLIFSSLMMRFRPEI